MKFFKQRLMNNYEEEWPVIPNTDLNLDEEDDKRSIAHLMLKDKIKEEKLDEGKSFQ